MIINAETINNAYDNLKATKSIAAERALLAADYKAILDAEIAHFVVTGEVVGKNAEERKAYLENKFAPGYAELRAKERAAELSRAQVELAQIEMNRLNALLSYMKLMQEAANE